MRINDSHQDAQQQKSTLGNGLEVSAEAQEAFIPRDFRTGLSRRAGPELGALNMRSKYRVAPSFTFRVPSRRSAPRMSVMDTLPGLQGPEIFWGAEGVAQGHDESEIKGYEGFGKFAAALESTGVAKDLAGSGPFTVLAPTDSAVDEFMANGGKITADVLKYHILPGKIATSDFSSANFKTMQGSTLQYKRFARKDFLDGVRIGVKSAGASKGGNYPADVEAGNGVIHTIDGVLVPGAYVDNTGDPFETRDR